MNHAVNHVTKQMEVKMCRCTSCGRSIENEENVLYGFDQPYCERCFDETFYYCYDCDRLIYQSDSYSDSAGNPICEDCHDNEDEDDPNCPENPAVTDLDREVIINLSNDWLNGRTNTMTTIKTKKGDYKLNDIKEKVGQVNNSVFVYGLMDREEYQLTATFDIITQVRDFLDKKHKFYTVQVESGIRRLGICKEFREKWFDVTVELIKAIGSERSEVVCAA